MGAVIVNKEISDEIKNNLKKYFDTLLFTETTKAYYPVTFHTDIQFHKIGNNLICHKNISEELLDNIKIHTKYKIFKSIKSIGEKYPGDIPLCAYSDEYIFIHNTKFTDPMLVEVLEKQSYNQAKEISSLKILNVNQAYSACTTSGIEGCYITNDEMIFKNIIDIGYKCLLLPAGDIVLEGFENGFIGGAVKFYRIKDKVILFTFGSIRNYKYGNDILDFYRKNGIILELIELGTWKLQDYGGMIIL